MIVGCAAEVCRRFLWEGDTSNKPFEWTGHHQTSAAPPQAPSLPLKGSVIHTQGPILAQPKRCLKNYAKGLDQLLKIFQGKIQVEYSNPIPMQLNRLLMNFGDSKKDLILETAICAGGLLPPSAKRIYAFTGCLSQRDSRRSTFPQLG